MTKDQKINDRKRIAVSYIFSFYNSVIYLIDVYSKYLNLLITLEGKNEESWDAHDKNQVSIIVQEVRYYCNATYIQFSTIKKHFENIKEKELEIDQSYAEINKRFIIEREQLKKYVIAMNSILVDDVIKEILETNQDLIEGVFNVGSTQE